MEMQFGECLRKSTNSQKLLGVKIDCKLTFDMHMKTVCTKVSNKLRTLVRVKPHMTSEKKRLFSFSSSL